MDDQSYQVVDPEIRAYVNSLVSALGGTGADQEGQYVLGDDALECLKDLKKWLRLHDEKNNRLDVARCLAEANLVKGDLLEILASWSESAAENRFKSKIALACMELLVPLTWPIEKNDAQMTVHHHQHVPFLQQAQISYKRAIIEHDSGVILRNCVRIALPSIALPMKDRASRDEGIIKLLLFLCRNIAMISQPREASSEGVSSRLGTIEAFRDQEILALLLTLSSNMGEDFNVQDTVVLEVLFHLLKGVHVEKLFMEKKQLADKSGNELKSLLSKESNLRRSYAKNAPTRHNRFGTMIWLKRDEEGRHSAISGQDVLKDGERALSKMDQTKKWNRPRRHAQNEEVAHDRFDLDEPLTDSARTHLRSFVEEFLDSCFNPLFNQIRRAIEREADRVLESHKTQYFYLISWFLEAERVRRQKLKAAAKERTDRKIDETFEPDNFGLVASVLTQESFVLLNRFMQDRLDMKAWRDLQAGLCCFTQTLLIVQDMAESPTEDDQEISENIQNRIFYEEQTHDRIIGILRGYKDQGFGYLNACTELVHVFLRMLERFSREHVDLQIRSRRRKRAARKAARQSEDKSQANGEAERDEEDSEQEDARETERTTRERQFDFKRFSAKFTTQACVDTFVHFLKYYNDLDPEQLKRAHRYFYRVAFKQEVSIMLFRLDIVALLYKIIKGPDNLDPKNPAFREWEELIRQVFKKMTKKIDQRPQLVIELLFSKINATTFFLENGYEKQTISTSRPPPALYIPGDFSVHQQIGIIVTSYSGQDPHSIIPWIISILENASEERDRWERQESEKQKAAQDDSGDVEVRSGNQSPRAPIITIIAQNEGIRTALFRDGRLRLLMDLCSFERLSVDDVPGATWMIPGTTAATILKDNWSSVSHFQQHPMTDFGNADAADELIRRKPAPKPQRAEYDDDSDGASNGEEDFLFPAGGPTNTVEKRQDALDLLKKRRRKRRKPDEEFGLSEEVLEARRKNREQAELERRRKIKSEEFIRDSDEENDEERDKDFFAREQEIRNGQRAKVLEALAAGRVDKTVSGEKVKSARQSKPSKKRKRGRDDDAPARNKRWKGSSDLSDTSSDDDDMDVAHELPARPAKPTIHQSDDSDESRDDEEESQSEKDTPLSSPPHLSKPRNRNGDVGGSVEEDPPSSQSEARAKTAELTLNSVVDEEEEDNDGDQGPVTINRRRPRAVFQDSDDE